MGLRRLFKKARKALHLPAITLGNVAKVGLAAAGGGIPAVGAAVLRSKLKSAAVGGVKRVLRGKAEKALLRRTQILAPAGSANAPAQTMPGGAPLAAAARALRTARGTHSRRKATRKGKRRARKVIGRIKGASDAYNAWAQSHTAADARREEAADLKAAKRAKRGTRKPPAGGKDFKALSVSWRAAGKPGRWIDWVKSH